jgi:hypothetical protein
MTISGVSSTVRQIYISDIMGHIVYQCDVDIDKDILHINTTNWPAGIYFVVCTNAQGVGECKKLIKQ